jgi:uncharacterized membrane protein YfcA
MRPFLNALVGFVVGVAGGLIGLGGAELRLPYLVGMLRLTPHQAVPINLAVSLLKDPLGGSRTGIGRSAASKGRMPLGFRADRVRDA